MLRVACVAWVLAVSTHAGAVSSAAMHRFEGAAMTHTDTSKVITGTITDSLGVPLSRATVIVPNTKLSAITDSTGHYRITITTNTTFSLRAVAEGFRPKQVDNLIWKGAPLVVDIALWSIVEEPALPAVARPSRGR